MRIVALLQGKEMILSRLGGVAALHRWGGRAQEQQALVLLTAELCHLPGMVAHHTLGLVAALLLLVQDDETQIGQGGKNCRAGTHNDLGASVPDALPLVIALARGQAAV